MGKDYYKILGVDRNADENAIKRGYRKMAMKWHPDRNKGKEAEATEKFKDINEAFEVLSDKNKKAIYDQYGEEGLKNGGGGMGGGGGSGGATYSNFHFSRSDPFDIFNKFFGGKDPFGGFGSGSFGNGRRGDGGSHHFSSIFGDSDEEDFFTGGVGDSHSYGHRRATKLPDIVHDLPLDLKDYYTGISKRLRIYRNEKQANGQYKKVPKVLEFEIPPGMKEGVGVRFAGEGDRGEGIIPADIVFKLRTNKHPNFERRGNDLIYHVRIPLLEALTGTTLKIQHLDGRVLSIPVQRATPNYEQTVWNEGMPIYNRRTNNGQGKGNLIIKFDIQFPQNVKDFSHRLNQRCMGRYC